jgi:hypothetical protein
MGMRWLVALGLLIAVAAPGCGPRCADIAARQRAMTGRIAVVAGAHAQVDIPFARANAVLAAVLRDQPVTAPLALPRLGPFALATRPLTATARTVELRPGPPDRVRFAIRVELADADQPITTLAIVAEVAPRFTPNRGFSDLTISFGPHELVDVKPELGAGAGRALVDAVARWLPPAVRDRLPHSVLDQAASRLAEYLTGEAYALLRGALLNRLGELTRLEFRLPDLPIAYIAIASRDDRLTVDLTTNLPIRRSLAAAHPPSDEITVRISASTAAELANWSIDHGRLPAHYTRELEPRPDGDHRPFFDYLASDVRRPVKVHVFGACEYFQVGLRLQLAIAGDKLDVAVLDRLVEHAEAAAPLELALWLKQLVQGAVDRSYRAAAKTTLTVGGRGFETHVIAAAMVDDELDFALQITPGPRIVGGTASLAGRPLHDEAIDQARADRSSRCRGSRFVGYDVACLGIR